MRLLPFTLVSLCAFAQDAGVLYETRVTDDRAVTASSVVLSCFM